jgi:SAM-dependent methyltransferase
MVDTADVLFTHVSKTRWRYCAPDNNLTWDKQVNGNAFIEMSDKYGAFGENKDILEIGPGYGRLLDAMLEKDVPFKSYTAVDISSNNIAFLEDKYYPSGKISLVWGDAENIELQGKYDTMISSLTMKHLYPSCEKALINISKYMKDNVTLCFDLIEGDHAGSMFQWNEPIDEITYVGMYSKDQISEILHRGGFRNVTFDTVVHTDGMVNFPRMFVVARR